MTPASSAKNDGIAAVLWGEALLLFCAGWFLGERWVLPAAGLVALFAGLMGALPRGGIVASLTCLALWAGLFARLSSPSASAAALPAIVALVLGAGHAFLQILVFGAAEAGGAPRSAKVRSCLLRLLTILHFAVAGALLAELYLAADFRWWIAAALAAFTLLLCAQVIAQYAGRAFTPPRYWGQLPEPGAFWFYRWLGPDWRAALGPPRVVTGDFHLQLAEMWMVPSLRGAMAPLLAASAGAAWLASGLHEVPAGSEGVRHRLGKWEPAPVGPGLHVSLPWPFGGISVVDTAKVREVVLGFQSDPGKPILWERAHYLNEQMSMVGGGDDYLSISVPVFYRIADPAKYLRSAKDAEGVLRSAADRALLQLTVRLPGEEIMTTARETLRREMQIGLQKELDRLETGIVLSEVYFRDIHPPVAVAPTFQEVVGAMEDKEAMINEAEAYRRGNRIQAMGTASALVVSARGAAATRLLQVNGQAGRLLAQQAAWAEAPELYQWRETFRVIDETLGGAKKAILDARLPKTSPAQIDLRRVLNPDLIEKAGPKPEMLVPGALRSRDAFDLDIEGFLRSGKGDVPAVNFAPEDSDNLLEKTPLPDRP